MRVGLLGHYLVEAGSFKQEEVDHALALWEECRKKVSEGIVDHAVVSTFGYPRIGFFLTERNALDLCARARL